MPTTSSSDGLSIGNLRLQSPVLLAPMAGYSDLAFRSIVRGFGGLGLACTEMLNPRSVLIGRGSRIRQLLATDENDTPLAHQLYGHEPDMMAEAARRLVADGASIIDINMGCPQRKIVRRGAGAALLKDTKLALGVVHGIVEAVSVPVTVKIRLGWSDKLPVARELVRELRMAGVAAVAVHARTAAQRLGGLADWSELRGIVEAADGMPIIGNGDIVTVEAARQVMRSSGCAGVMIGRQALREPWITRDIAAALRGEAVPTRPDRAAHVRLMRLHLERMVGQYGDDLAARLFRKWTPQYAKTLPLRRDDMIGLIETKGIAALREAIERLQAL